jgi:hypothetical protein
VYKGRGIRGILKIYRGVSDMLEGLGPISK